MRFMILAAVAALTFASAADAKSCKDANGKFIKCPAAAAQTTTKAMASAGAKSATAASKTVTSTASKASTEAGKAMAAPAKAATPHTGPAKCKTGVPCGNSCIPKGKVCHKS
jgi:hypothetical protein